MFIIIYNATCMQFSTRRAAEVNTYDEQFTTSTAMHPISVNVASNIDTYSRLDHSVSSLQQHSSQSSSDIYHKLDRSIKPEQQCSSVDCSDYSTLSNVLMESKVNEKATSISECVCVLMHLGLCNYNVKPHAREYHFLVSLYLT